MRTRLPRRPEGSDDATKFMQWVYDVLAQEHQFIDTPTVAVTRTTKGVGFKAKVNPPGQAGTGMVLKGEWDPMKAYAKQSVVTLSSGVGQGSYCAAQAIGAGVNPADGGGWTSLGGNVLGNYL